MKRKFWRPINLCVRIFCSLQIFTAHLNLLRFFFKKRNKQKKKQFNWVRWMDFFLYFFPFATKIGQSVRCCVFLKTDFVSDNETIHNGCASDFSHCVCAPHVPATHSHKRSTRWVVVKRDGESDVASLWHVSAKEINTITLWVAQRAPVCVWTAVGWQRVVLFGSVSATLWSSNKLPTADGAPSTDFRCTLFFFFQITHFKYCSTFFNGKFRYF